MRWYHRKTNLHHVRLVLDSLISIVFIISSQCVEGFSEILFCSRYGTPWLLILLWRHSTIRTLQPWYRPFNEKLKYSAGFFLISSIHESSCNLALQILGSLLCIWFRVKFYPFAGHLIHLLLLFLSVQNLNLSSCLLLMSWVWILSNFLFFFFIRFNDYRMLGLMMQSVGQLVHIITPFVQIRKYSHRLFSGLFLIVTLFLFLIKILACDLKMLGYL